LLIFPSTEIFSQNCTSIELVYKVDSDYASTVPHKLFNVPGASNNLDIFANIFPKGGACNSKEFSERRWRKK